MSNPAVQKQNDVSLSFLAAGDSDWIDKVVIPLAKPLLLENVDDVLKP